ncbi:MAG TPA: alpha/beta fold hydrolase [Thermoanaerobaculia bacterium]|jgi:predicted alpha/beta-hydrolase family hydrolase|nr:alpha/beta fold hydrolase [Thermoanaerobaculia bacterium]
MPSFLWNGPDDASITLILAHGAGAPMDSSFLEKFAKGLADRGIRVARFEFPYMHARREGGSGRAPDRTPVLLDSWRAAYAAVQAEAAGPVAIGGKSLGGRMASMIADEVSAAGLVCLGYPFHPPGQLEKLRTAHLAALTTPTLIAQGTRDPFGTREEVAGYTLSPAIRIEWIESGEHSWKPLARSGRTEAQNLEAGIEAVAVFLTDLSDR